MIRYQLLSIKPKRILINHTAATSSWAHCHITWNRSSHTNTLWTEADEHGHMTCSMFQVVTQWRCHWIWCKCLSAHLMCVHHTFVTWHSMVVTDTTDALLGALSTSTSSVQTCQNFVFRLGQIICTSSLLSYAVFKKMWIKNDSPYITHWIVTAIFTEEYYLF